ncbi:PP2C family protein-serine/threonine phosphatase [Fodinibius sp. Rm-B-1B1-1]|uniref:PP2C family protein-serine/threonine phosphatase n=1 Tax=Fodinibius alkaliphilus TaxID=3140241 RepID=UPI00315A5F58
MSLLNKNQAFNVSDFIFIAVGLLCVFGFFLSYSSQEPRSAIHTELSEHTAKGQADSVYNALGYSSAKYANVSFNANKKLFDSLQADYGRQQVIQRLKRDKEHNIYPYYWEIRYSNEQQSSNFSDGEEYTIIRLNEEGKLIEFANPTNKIPANRVNREALIAAFDADANLELWKTLPDSAWDRVLRFDTDRGYQEIVRDDSVAQSGDDSQVHMFTRSNINNLATYYLINSGWDVNRLELSNIQIETVHSQPVADVSFTSVEPSMNQDITVDLQLLSTGVLVNLDVVYNNPESEEEFPGVLDMSRLAGVLIFGLAVVVLFFFRIRSRAIDTKSALVVGILAGLIIPAMVFLERWRETSLFGDSQSMDLLSLVLQMGFAGAFSSIIFFTLFAVGDSLMRQYWPEKLYSYDYLRQGMLFNKPIGEMILRSTVLAFILCGIWSGALYVFPELSFDVERTFLTYEAAWPPLYSLLQSGIYSLSVVLIAFSIIGAQAYDFFKNEWVTSGIIVVAILLISPTEQAVGPALQEAAVFGIMGIALTTIFLKWDLLTTFFSHLVFLLMIEVSTGWIVPDSPDLYIFLILCGFLGFNIVAGILFLTKGVTQQSLSEYVPDYVEALAQEERIKQELQIAREVQQSFLPTRKPHFQGLDMAAICKPAYETGGDYYDFIRLDDHRIAITIGDVSGKGFQAAFYMTFIKGILHSLCREIDSPAEILKKVNRLFYDNAQRGTFISLVYGIIDLQKQTFTFARAGHNPILKVGSNGLGIEELKPSGIGIGLSRDSFDEHIEEVSVSLSDNELLILYTDGIVEALNEHHKFYGSERFNKMVSENAKKSAKQILDLLAHDVHSFIGDAKQHDDMTIMVMKLNGKNSK